MIVYVFIYMFFMVGFLREVIVFSLSFRVVWRFCLGIVWVGRYSSEFPF